MIPTRTERDSFGRIEVPARHLWGAQTQRSLAHFAISGERMPVALIHALALVKAAAARVNADLGLLPEHKAAAIVAAAEEVVCGRWDEEFPLVVWQTGSGTQTHMNVNEVIANRASQLLGGEMGEGRGVHANDEVNLGQSSNDVLPTAMHVAAVLALTGSDAGLRRGGRRADPAMVAAPAAAPGGRALLPALAALQAAFAGKAETFAEVVKIGRTHFQDATPLTLGQEFSAYVAQLSFAKAQLEAALPALHPLAIGGTAVGTGLNTHPEFGARVAALLAQRTGMPFVSAENKFAALAAHDGMVAVHGALRTLAVVLRKIADDLRLLASGPRAGLGEISLPENEPGSSIMPGKVNPTQCEALAMVAIQVLANDLAIGLAGSSGSLQLNVYKPLIAQCFLQSARLLADAMASFTSHCVAGITVNRERIGELLERSLMLVTALVPHIGYDRAAEIAHLAQRDRATLRETAIRLGYVSAEQYDRWVVPAAMTVPGREAGR
jgi:fumarate hydratase class II